jgi:hypothetical protein
VIGHSGRFVNTTSIAYSFSQYHHIITLQWQWHNSTRAICTRLRLNSHERHICLPSDRLASSESTSGYGHS